MLSISYQSLSIGLINIIIFNVFVIIWVLSTKIYKTRNITRYDNDDDLSQLDSILKISTFSEVYDRTSLMKLICKNS